MDGENLPGMEEEWPPEIATGRPHTHTHRSSSYSDSVCVCVYRVVGALLYPCEVPLEAVDVQLRPLGVDLGADGEQVLRHGGMTEHTSDSSHPSPALGILFRSERQTFSLRPV